MSEAIKLSLHDTILRQAKEIGDLKADLEGRTSAYQHILEQLGLMVKWDPEEDDDDTDTPVYTPDPIAAAIERHMPPDDGCPGCGALDGDVCAETCPQRIARAKAAESRMCSPCGIDGHISNGKDGCRCGALKFLDPGKPATFVSFIKAHQTTDCSCAACQNTADVPHAPGCPWYEAKHAR